ncbi:MAG: type II secretion system F family protein [Elusimicrobia bacterium]|nr:type II secretion system F family protein [Elusimicrobiota bacterium]
MALVFNNSQMQTILCAQKRAQLFFFYLSPENPSRNQIAHYNLLRDSKVCKKDETIHMPKWIDEVLPKMVNHPVWQDPQEGVLSEAKLWQTPISVLYEFFEITKKSFPPEAEGAGIPPGLLVKEYAENRVKLQMSLDRVYRAEHRKREGKRDIVDWSMKDSLGGRGRSILAALDLAMKEMESIADAISSTKPGAYAQAAVAIAALSDNAFYQLMEAPRGPRGQPEGPSSAAAILPWVLPGLGTLFMVLAFWRFGQLPRVHEYTERYMVRSGQWAEAFNRQFVQIKIKYLVLAPFLLFSLMGLLTLNFFGFLIFSAAGLFLGLKTPEWVLNYIRQKRGKQIETQLMDALILMGNALKSGLDIVQAFEMVHRDLLPPISDEFGLVIRNYQLGTPFEKSLEGLEERVESRLLSYMIKAIVIQRQVGGNLTKIFDRIIENIREEGKLEEKTKSLTAQQRIQSIVVGVMPWIMLAIMFMFQGPVMAKFYFTPIGVFVLLFCAGWIAIGMRVVKSLGNIRV